MRPWGFGPSLGLMAWGLGFQRVWGFGFRVSEGLGFKALGFGAF